MKSKTIKELQKGCGNVIRKVVHGNQRVWNCGIKDEFYKDEIVPLCCRCEATLKQTESLKDAVEKVIDERIEYLEIGLQSAKEDYLERNVLEYSSRIFELEELKTKLSEVFEGE